MTYTTRCTCTEAQLNLIGCDCDHTGPEKIVKTYEDLAAEAEQAYFKHIADEEAKEIAYWNAQFAADQIDTFADAREDHYEWSIKAAKFQ